MSRKKEIKRPGVLTTDSLVNNVTIFSITRGMPRKEAYEKLLLGGLYLFEGMKQEELEDIVKKAEQAYITE